MGQHPARRRRSGRRGAAGAGVAGRAGPGAGQRRRAHLSDHSFLWSDEVARLALSILAFIGGAVAYRRRDHAFVRIVLNLVAEARRAHLPGARRRHRAVRRRALPASRRSNSSPSSWNERTPILQLPAALIGLPLPLGMALLAFYAIVNLSRARPAVAWCVGAPSCGDMALAALTPRRLAAASRRRCAIVAALALFFLCDLRRRAGGIRAAAADRDLSVGERRPPPSWCCRKPWSTAPAISFCWRFRSSFWPA